jgi:NADH-quinone oxidoreductase subunit L
MNLWLLWLVPLLPLFGSALNGLMGKKNGREFTTVFGVGTVWAAFFIAIYLTYGFLTGSHVPQYLQSSYDWFDAGVFRLQIGLMLDRLSLIMMLMVTGVGALIHTYSIGYMWDDPGYNRYFAYLNLFAFSMLVLVLADGFLLLFVGWELVGLCSYLLIGFWYDRRTAADAGRKAFIVNRVGDWAFLIGIILTFVVFTPHSIIHDAAGHAFSDGLRFHTVFSYLRDAVAVASGLPAELRLVPVIALLLFIGAMGKSAQLPLLHIWLPDAMEGPTPVSALIHAATMVTAGVYMVVRCHDLYAVSPAILHLVAWIGALTAFAAASIAIVQTDIKRVLAYSTISQLGYMFIGAGTGAFGYSIFHLLTHAFFKALLFLCAGAVIHAMANEQDMRKMGGLWRHPSTRPLGILMAIGVLAIAGFPGFSGFFSKDLILGRAAEQSIALWAVATAAAFMTAFYMTRLWFMTFGGQEHWKGQPAESAGRDHPADAPDTTPEPGAGGDGHAGHGLNGEPHRTPATMLIPMWILAVLSVVAGGALYRFVPGFLAPMFVDLPVPVGRAGLSEGWFMAISALVFVAGTALAFYAYGRDNTEPKPWMVRDQGTYRFLANAWYIDRLAHAFFADGGLEAANATYRDIEVRGIDQGGVGGVAHLARWMGRELRLVQSGIVGHYALAMAFGAACVVLYFMVYFLLR